MADAPKRSAGVPKTRTAINPRSAGDNSNTGEQAGDDEFSPNDRVQNLSIEIVSNAQFGNATSVEKGLIDLRDLWHANEPNEYLARLLALAARSAALMYARMGKLKNAILQFDHLEELSKALPLNEDILNHRLLAAEVVDLLRTATLSADNQETLRNLDMFGVLLRREANFFRRAARVNPDRPSLLKHATFLEAKANEVEQELGAATGKFRETVAGLVPMTAQLWIVTQDSFARLLKELQASIEQKIGDMPKDSASPEMLSFMESIAPRLQYAVDRIEENRDLVLRNTALEEDQNKQDRNGEDKSASWRRESDITANFSNSAKNAYPIENAHETNVVVDENAKMWFHDFGANMETTAQRNWRYAKYALTGIALTAYTAVWGLGAYSGADLAKRYQQEQALKAAHPKP
jgi:hypothetical protein